MRSWTCLIVVPLLVLAGCGGQETGEEHASDCHDDEHNHAHAHPVSDLDRPLSELLAARCEHEMRALDCDECRYEVGFVKVQEDLVGAGKGIETVFLAPRPPMEANEVPGEVVLNEERSVWLSPRAAGVVRAIRVDLGAEVSARQVLYEVDSLDVSEARAAFVIAAAELDLARATLARESELFARKICPEKDLIEARAAFERASAGERAVRERLLRYGLEDAQIKSIPTAPVGAAGGVLSVRAPFAGTVLERSLSLGALVSPGDRTLLLADTARIWVQALLYEREVALVGDQQAQRPVRAEVTVPAYPGRVFAGVVERVGGTLDETTRTARARVVVDNPDKLLRAGMLARVRLSLSAGVEVLAIPAESVLEDEGRCFAFIRHDKQTFVRRPVQLGRTWPGWAEVMAGLSEGQEVVSRGAFLLKSDVLRSKMGAGCAD